MKEIKELKKIINIYLIDIESALKQIKMDAEKLIKKLREDAVPLPTTEYANGYNKGIESAIKIIEEMNKK